MAAPYLDHTEKLEHAAQAVVEALAYSGLFALTGSDDGEKKVPNAQCSVLSSQEEPAFSGNYRSTLEIRVASRAVESGLAAHRAIVATVFDAFHDDDLATTLSDAIEDFHVIGIGERRLSKENTDTQYVDILELDVYSCPSDL